MPQKVQPPKEPTLFRAFSVFLDLVAFVYLLFNLKPFSMTNPSVIAFVCALYFTAIIFWGKLFLNKIRSGWKRMFGISIIIVIGLFIGYFFIAALFPKGKPLPQVANSGTDTAKSNNIQPITSKPDSVKGNTLKAPNTSAPSEETQKSEFMRQEYISGIILPEMLIKGNKNIIIKAGRNEFGFSIEELKKGVDVSPIEDSGNHSDLNLRLQVVHNQLLVSSTFRDLEHEVVGQLVNNKLNLLKDKILNYKHNNRNMEVLDRSGYVIFRLSFIAPDTLKYCGYYSGLYSIAIIEEDGIWAVDTRDPDYKLKALKEIENLKPIFKYP